MAELILTPAKYSKMSAIERREHVQLWKVHGWRNKELQVIMPTLQKFTVSTSCYAAKPEKTYGAPTLTLDQVMRLFRCVESGQDAQYVCRQVNLTEQELLGSGSLYATLYSLIRQNVTAPQMKVMLTLGLSGETIYAMSKSTDVPFYLAKKVRKELIDAGVVVLSRE